MDKIPPEVLAKIKEANKAALADPAKLDAHLETTWKNVAGDAEKIPVEKIADLMKEGSRLHGRPEPKKEMLDLAVNIIKKEGVTELDKEYFKKRSIEQMKKMAA